MLMSNYFNYLWPLSLVLHVLDMLKAEHWPEGLAFVGASKYCKALYNGLRGDYEEKLKFV